MKVAKKWLNELVDIKISEDKLIDLIPLRVQGGIKEVTDKYIELDLKGYNRADLLSLRGVAYEFGAITDSTVLFDEDEDYIWIKGYEDDNHTPIYRTDLSDLTVEIEDTSLSPLYSVAKITGLKVGPSPKEWVEKLEASGMRSVNNIADITNLVMLEYGQPLHAFDASKVKDDTIIVRRAKDREKTKTLDDKERILSSDDIVIADKDSILGVAGVMGGKDSEIKDSTTDILLEAAIFNPVLLRKTATKLKLTSEASKRFIHGLTIKRLKQAFDKAIRMYQELGGVLIAISAPKNEDDKPKIVRMSTKKVRQLIGVEIENKRIEEYLTKLHFEKVGTKEGEEGDLILSIQPPYYRLDIEIEEDLIEEVARMYGYEKIPAKELEGEFPKRTDQSLFELISRIKQQLTNHGLDEVQTYSFSSTQVLDNLGWNETFKSFLVKVTNPISKETEYLRQGLWGNLLEVVSKNFKNGMERVGVFEIGKVYSKSQDKSIKEEYALAGALLNGTDSPIIELYQIIKPVFERFNFDVEFKESTPPEIVKNILHPVRFYQILKNGKEIGGISEVHPRVTYLFGVEKRVAVFEIHLESFLK